MEQAELISVAASFNTSTRFNSIILFYFFTLLGHRKARARNPDHTNIFTPVHMQGLSFCGQICTDKFVLLFIFQCKQKPGLHISDAPVPPMLQCLRYRWNLNECNHLISHVADLLWGPACSHLYTCSCTSILVRPWSDIMPPPPHPHLDLIKTVVLPRPGSTQPDVLEGWEYSKHFFDGSLLTLPQLLQ